MGTEEASIARMAIRAPDRGCGVIFVFLFVGSFVALALFNLVNHYQTGWWGLIASVLWLALVVLALWGTLREVGVREAAVHLLGEFSQRHFVEAAGEGDELVIGFGYTLFGRDLYYVRVPGERVAALNMGSGQATAVAGRDMNDWSVACWYHNPDSPEKPIVGLPANELHLVGAPWAKAETERTFRELITFLRAAGVELQATEDDHKFRVTGAGGRVAPSPPV